MDFSQSEISREYYFYYSDSGKALSILRVHPREGEPVPAFAAHRLQGRDR
jgi:hypothetical protein